eukprot:300737-Alexandrium_andersonii.AAC.1
MRTGDSGGRTPPVSPSPRGASPPWRQADRGFKHPNPQCVGCAGGEHPHLWRSRPKQERHQYHEATEVG